jgi:hypothetical protein
VQPCEQAISFVLISNCGSVKAVASELQRRFLFFRSASTPSAVLSTLISPRKLL